jgi:hypothetical protein
VTPHSSRFFDSLQIISSDTVLLMSSKTKVIAVDKVVNQKQTAIVTANNHYAGLKIRRK